MPTTDADVVTISRETLFNGYGRTTPFSWLYTVTVPGKRPMVGKGIDWARMVAKKHGDGRKVVYTWK